MRHTITALFLITLACDGRALPQALPNDSGQDTSLDLGSELGPPPMPWEVCLEPPGSFGIAALECEIPECRTCWLVPNMLRLIGCTVENGKLCVTSCSDCPLIDRDR
jgi:hypothetical protein